MGQDELVLRVAPDSSNTTSTASRTCLKRDIKTDPTATSKQRSHSRESSGASNLSVKFTVHSDGSASPKASVTTPYQYDAKIKPVTSCLRKRHDDDAAVRRERRRKRHLQSPQRRCDDKSEASHEESFYEDSDDSLNMEEVDRLSPDSVDGTSRGGIRMLHGDSKSQNSDYGSFCNTPSDTFGAVGGVGPSSGPGGGAYQQPTSGGDQHHRGHQRNDSEIQIGNDAYQRRPLLENHDSSSDDDTRGASNFGFTRKSRRMPRGGAANVQIDIPANGDASNLRDDESDDSDDDDGIPSEPIKTLVAFIFLFFAWVATTTSLALTHERVPQIAPLPDIILDNVQYQPWGLDASEILIMVSTWTAFVVSLFHKHRFIVLRRIFLLVGIHYYYRAVTMFITVLPKSNEEYVCAPKLNVTTAAEIAQRVLKLLSGMGLSINGKHVYCGDYIYSGHTMTLIMGYFVIREYSPRSWFLLHWASLFTTVAGVVMLLLARGHYSIDVVIAYWITTRIWWMYHTLANNVSLKGEVDNPQNYLNRIWWWYIFRYFERSVPCNLPRRFGWPIPKKLRRWKPTSFFFRRRSLRSAASPTASTAGVAPSSEIDVARSIP